LSEQNINRDVSLCQRRPSETVLCRFNVNRTKKRELTWIRCLSITAAESLLIGLGVLFTTTRRIHCSHLQKGRISSKMSAALRAKKGAAWYGS